MGVLDTKQTLFPELWATFAVTWFLHVMGQTAVSFPFHLLWFAIYCAFDRTIDIFFEITLLRLYTSWKNNDNAAAVCITEFVGRVVAQCVGAFLGGWLGPLITDTAFNGSLGFPNVAADDRWKSMLHYAIIMSVFFWVWLNIPKRAENSLTRNLAFTLHLVATTAILNFVAPGAVVGLNVNFFRMIGYKLNESSLDIATVWLYIVGPMLGFGLGVGIDWLDNTLGCLDDKACEPNDDVEAPRKEEAPKKEDDTIEA